MERPDIKNLKELYDYLTLMEDRITELESQDQVIKNVINKVNHDLQDSKRPWDRLPTTGLLSHNFFTRAFTVMGHYMVASLIIGLIFFFVYLAMFVAILGNSMNFFTNILKLIAK